MRYEISKSYVATSFGNCMKKSNNNQDSFRKLPRLKLYTLKYLFVFASS